MLSEQLELEQRRDMRYLAKDRALIMVPSSAAPPCHIVDISGGGLAFRYLGAEEWGDDFSEVDIFFEDALYLEKVPVKVVSDCMIKTGFVPVRRRGLQFLELSPSHQSKLKYYINKYTVGEA